MSPTPHTSPDPRVPLDPRALDPLLLDPRDFREIAVKRLALTAFSGKSRESWAA